jgi:acyl-CoA thioesterase-1
VLAALALIVLAAAGGCERAQRSDAPPPRADHSEPSAPETGSEAAARRGTDRAAPGASEATAASTAGVPVLLVLGDSLTAGYGLPTELAYPARIQERIHEAGLGWRVVNAGVSGDTSAGGLARLDWLLRQRVDVMLLALGANDGLRGQDPDAMRDNLARIIERAQGRGIRVVLAGMRMPTNYGPEYTRHFAAVFPALAARYDLAFVPFLLEDVAMQPTLNQADGIHPNEQGAQIIADHVWPVLVRVLREEAAAAAAAARNAGR